MKKHLKLGFLVLILLGMGWLFFHSKTKIQNNDFQDSHELTVRVVHPQKTDVLEPLAFSARIYPIESALIFSRANGFLQERFVDIGDHVKQGQLLARLSSPELEEQIKQAQAQIQLQEATIAARHGG